MTITIGKLSWVITILLIAFMSYNMNLFNTVSNKINSNKAISEYTMSNQELSVERAIPSEQPVQPESNNLNLQIKLERVKWEMEKLNDRLVDLEIQIEELDQNEEDTLDTLLAIITTLSPLLIPIITSRLNGKQIILKRG